MKQELIIEQKQYIKNGYVRKKGNNTGKVIGHYNASMRLDIYNRLMEIKEKIGMGSETRTEFWAYVANHLEETLLNTDTETKAQKQFDKQGVKDIDTIMTMSDEEVEREIARLGLDKKDNDESSNIS